MHLGLEHDERLHGLAPGVVGHADDGALQHRGVAGDGLLHLHRVDVLAAGDDHVLGPVDDEHVALVVPAGDVPGPHPAVADGLVGEIRAPEVAEHVGLGAHHDLAGRLAVGGHIAAVGMHHPHRGHEALPPAGAQPLGPVVLVDRPQVVLLGQEAHGGALGLAVALDERAGEPVQGLGDDPRRHRAAPVLDVAQAGDVVAVEALHRHHPVQHRGDAQERRHPLGLDEVHRQAGVEVHQHQRAAVSQVVDGQHDRDVEHLTGEHVDVAGHDALGHRLVQHPEPAASVAVQRTLGLPGGAAGVEDEQRVVAADGG